MPTDPLPSPASGGRVFRFRCLRCASVLEADSTQCGQEARCPTCDAVFAIPAIDASTGLALTNADPGDDGQDPTPMHAYAAAGHRAPRIVRREDDSLVIECSRCRYQSPISSDNCPSCGLPFTLEGASDIVTTADTRVSSSSLVLAVGLAAVPLALCGGIGVVPGGIACLWGGKILLGKRPHHDTGIVIAGMALGGLACIISALMWLHA